MNEEVVEEEKEKGNEEKEFTKFIICVTKRGNKVYVAIGKCIYDIL